ncbi:hypothetical protein OIY81_3225 [Cryptosporidium canis]|uniref:Uncharacterized protein n=1 Tax=Cryptosporidium canis TaxID=195482 RepID=A0ABQ8P438_9CRYT|nr:hypothetical protein OIY81_3225 [Cryptosporidium canis]KAJ1607529.1 hypothetical protein OJ252_2822 [Cryptosporidium canis]
MFLRAKRESEAGARFFRVWGLDREHEDVGAGVDGLKPGKELAVGEVSRDGNGAVSPGEFVGPGGNFRGELGEDVRDVFEWVLEGFDEGLSGHFEGVLGDFGGAGREPLVPEVERVLGQSPHVLVGGDDGEADARDMASNGFVVGTDNVAELLLRADLGEEVVGDD